MKRRDFIWNTGLLTVSLASVTSVFSACRREEMQKRMLLRYDTEWWGAPEEMAGFLEKLLEVHRKDDIPVTLFCRGFTLENMKDEFRAFHQEISGDPLFDLQDHSYSHIGLGYEKGKTADELEADYRRSFDIHEEILGKRPVGISRCGTSDDGPSLEGFDATEKSRKEFEMLVRLGVKMVDTFLTGRDGSREFIHYGRLGHPEVMGFISGFSDTAWMDRKEHGDPVEYVLGEIKKRSGQNEHMPVMFHDWVAWHRAPDKELTHVRRIAEAGRKQGYKLMTHYGCYQDKALWQGGS